MSSLTIMRKAQQHQLHHLPPILSVDQLPKELLENTKMIDKDKLEAILRTMNVQLMGSSANGSNPSMDEFGVDQPQLYAMMAHHLAIILLTLFGNCLLAFVIMKNNSVLRRKRVTPVQMLMLHMCAADLLFALVTILPTMGITATVPVFHGPDGLCKFVKFIQVIPMYASAFLLVAISADRYQAICRPLASIKSSAYNRPAIYAMCAWSAAVVFATPQIFIFGKHDDDCTVNYTSDWQYPMYVICFNVVVWLLPSAIAGFLYYRVCCAVWQSSMFGGSFKREKTSADSLLPASGSTCQLQIHHKGVRVQCVELDRRRVQTVKLTLTIVAANFCLWAPFCIISVIDAVWPAAISPVFATYIMFFGNLNSCVNPWIWFYFNGDHLRRAFSCRASTQPVPMRSHATHTEYTNMEYLNGHSTPLGDVKKTIVNQ